MPWWSPITFVNSAPTLAYEAAVDGNWWPLAVWLGDPPQLLNAFISTSGTTLQVPIAPSCSGNGAFNDTLPPLDYGPENWHEWRYEWRDIYSQGRYAQVDYLPQKSHTWKSSSGCSRGTDILRGSLWTPMERMYNVYVPHAAIEVPLEQTTGIAKIGVRGLANAWLGRQDYWWPLMTQTATTLIQSLDILSLLPVHGETGFQYTYHAGSYYAGRPASFWIGAITYEMDADAPFIVRQLSRPLSRDGALLLDDVKLDLIVQNSSTIDRITIPLLPRSSQAVLDSTLPFLELPKDLCFQIAEELALQYDQARDLFLMDESTLSRLQTRRPSLRFFLGEDPLCFPDSPPGLCKVNQFGGSFEVELPYEDLNHMHTPGLRRDGFPDRLPYFPIRIAEEGRGIVFGRTLFQEIYVSVNYHANQFSILSRTGWKYRLPEKPWNPDQPKQGLASRILSQITLTLVLTIVVLPGFLLLPLLKIGYNLQERRQRKRRLERLWVYAHTLTLAPEELTQYANATASRTNGDASHLAKYALKADAVLQWLKRTCRNRSIAGLWVIRRYVNNEGAIRLEDNDQG